MAHIHHPILGDQVYGGRLQLPRGASPALVEMLRGFKHQALHAFELGLIHPATKESMHWRAPLPADFKTLVECLRDDIAPTEDDDDDY
jgi:23S rRNA pseudouridine1911/1915/1917 synthase